MATRLYELLPFFYFFQLSFGQISFIGPRETVETLPKSLSGLQPITILDFSMLPVTLQRENYTSTWTLPNGEMVSEENQSVNPLIFVAEGPIEVNATVVPSTTLLVQGLSYTDAGVYRCSVQDDRNPGSPPIEATIELRLTVTLTAINSSVTIMDNASFVELSCDMSAYIRPDDQLQWFRDGEMITSGQDRRQITFMDGAGRGQFGGLTTQSSRVLVLTISNPISSDTGVYNCRVMETTESVDIALIVQSSALFGGVTEISAIIDSTTVRLPTNTSPETTQTPILTIVLGVTIGGLVLLLILSVISTVCVVKRKSLKQHHQQNNRTNDQAYEYPDELPSPPPPQPETTDHDIQMATYNDSPDHNYETPMNTTNPAYGLTLSTSGGISVDTNIAYGMTTNSAQQEYEVPLMELPTQPL